MNHYESIPIGKEKAISRYQLCKMWQSNERQVRRIIEQMRKQDNGDDYVIVSTAQSAGYFRTNDRDEIRSFKEEVTRRGKHTFRPLRKVNRILGIHEHQVSSVNQLKMVRLEAKIKAEEVTLELKKIDPRFDGSLLSKIENGLCMPTPQQLQAMSRLYDRPFDDLIGVYLQTE